MSTSHFRRIACSLAVTLVLTAGCFQQTSPSEPGTDAADDGDEHTGNGKADDLTDTRDGGLPDTDHRDAPDGAANDGETGDDSWECAPDLELDEERYGDVEPLDGTQLADELRQRVADHQDLGYDGARDVLWDIETRDHGELECLYTDDRVEPDGTNLPGGQFNTEHTWPQSRGADFEPRQSDLHHMFAAQMDANSKRGHREFGRVGCNETTCNWHEDGSFLGPSADDDREMVFEVQPERRGDVARAIFYFALRYDRDVSTHEEAVLRDWHCDDPPDDYERTRNDEIEEHQQNRNPFIDRPDFVDRIDEF